jgi:tRNA-Thr(GGU) m(6)t(6)A37 methyltransferase TsaA
LSDDEIRRSDHDVESTVEIFEEFQEGLDGVDGFSHLFVLGYLNKLRPDQIGTLKVRPRRLLERGLALEDLPIIGVFAISSPTRPNPIGLTLVEKLRRQGRHIVVRGLDFFDGTPVIDIKPYHEGYRANEFHVPDWYSKLKQREPLWNKSIGRQSS